MFTLKKQKKDYLAPNTMVTEVDLERQLLTGSLKIKTSVTEWENVNADTESEEVFYLESFDN